MSRILDTDMHNASQRHSTLSVVCPCYDEAPVIRAFYETLAGVLESLEDLACEVIFVDDGSTDETLSILNDIAQNDARVRICALSRNFGHQIALTAGLDHADGDAVVMLDTDLQHPPDLIPQMVAKWREGYDVVSAVRRDTADTTWFKDVTSKGFYSLINRISHTKIPEGVADFSLLARPAYEQLRRMRERHRFVRGMISWIGFKRAFLPYDAHERPAGRSKYTVLRMMSFAADGVLSFSSAPLRAATHIGAVVTGIGFVYLAAILVRWAVLRDLVPGWASLIAVTLILGGCQLLFIGLIGQYLARVFDEVKGRPIYVMKQTPPRVLTTAQTGENQTQVDH
jgi:glycosyltransferase involved in cell wall biosynthesis